LELYLCQKETEHDHKVSDHKLEPKCEFVMDHKMHHSTSECLQEVAVKEDEWEIGGDTLTNNNLYLLKTKSMRRQRARRVQRCIENDPKFTCFKPV
jgi:hypothetical protein